MDNTQYHHINKFVFLNTSLNVGDVSQDFIFIFFFFLY